MSFSKKNKIISQSAYLNERLFAYRQVSHTHSNFKLASSDVAEKLWINNFNSTDVNLFKKRIKWGGIKNENEVSLLEAINSDVESKEFKDLLEKIID